MESAPKDGTKIVLFCKAIYMDRKGSTRIGWWVEDKEKQGWLTKPLPDRPFFEEEIVHNQWPKQWKSIEHWNEEQDEIASFHKMTVEECLSLCSKSGVIIGPMPRAKIESEHLK